MKRAAFCVSFFFSLTALAQQRASAPQPAADAPSSPSSGSPRGTTGLAGLRPVEHPKVITLDEAFALAAAKSTDLRVTEQQIAQSKANVTKAWAVLLPNASLSADYTYNFPEQEAAFGSADQFQQQALLFESIANLTDGAAAQNPDPVQRRAAQEQAAELRATAKSLRESEVPSFTIQPAHVVGGAVTVAMPLFNGRAFPLLQNAYAAVDITKLGQQQAQAAVLWGVARTYHALASTKRLIETAHEQVERTERHLQRTKDRHELGYETALSVERAGLEVKKAQMQEKQARAGLSAAKAGLAGLLGVVEDFEIEAPPAVGITPVGSFDELLARAHAARVDLRVQKEMLAIADRGRQDAWMRFLPSFQIVAQGRYTSNTSGLTSQPFTGAVIVQGSLPLYDGGATFGALDEAAAKVNIELLRTRQLEETIERELRGTLDDLAVKQDNATTAAELAELAKKTADNADALYGEGAVTQSDVADARLGAFAAEVEAQKAQLELETARLGLAYALGELSIYIKATEITPSPVAAEEEERARSFLDR